MDCCFPIRKETNLHTQTHTQTHTHTHTHAKDTLHIQTHSFSLNLVNEINPTSFLNEHYYQTIILIAEASKINNIYVLRTYRWIQI